MVKRVEEIEFLKNAIDTLMWRNGEYELRFIDKRLGFDALIGFVLRLHKSFIYWYCRVLILR